MEKFFNRVKFYLLFGIKFPKGYEYTGWKCSEPLMFDYCHSNKIEEGWEQYSDILEWIGNAYCLYRKPINN